MVSPVPCSVGDIKCEDYISSGGEECVVSATLRYSVENTGRTCFDITSLYAKVGNENPRVITLDRINNTNFCPNDVMVFVERRPLDICQYRGLLLPVELKINDDVDASGRLTLLTASPTQAPLSLTKEPSMKTPFSPPMVTSKKPSLIPSAVLIPETNVPSTLDKICSTSPTTVWFLFEPRLCKDSNGWKFQKEGKKLKSRSNKYVSRSKGSLHVKTGCSDKTPVASLSRLLITTYVGSRILYDEIVKEGEEVKISELSGLAKIQVTIFHMHRRRKSQTFTLDYNKATKVGDIFASLRMLNCL